MKRALTLLAIGLLCACAPGQTGRTASSSAQSSLPFQADFTDAGVTWVANGQAYVARAPGLKPQLSPLPSVAVSAAWVGNVAWGALPGPGLIVTLDGSPQTQNVGRVARLTHSRIYRQDGTAQSYGADEKSGGEAGGVLGFPDAAITGGDGGEYVRVGPDLYQPGAGASSSASRLSSGALPYLYALPRRGAATANLPTVQADSGSLYRLTGSALERLDGTGRVLASVAHGPGLIGVVGGRVVTLSAAGQIRVFLVDLREVRA